LFTGGGGAGRRKQYIIWFNIRKFIYVKWRRCSISYTGGGVQGPLRSNTAGTAGSATISASPNHIRKF
jgi:hypothetical protein